MSSPGSGRYTRYVPKSTDRSILLKKLFNDKAGEAGKIYGNAAPGDFAAAAAAAVASARANAAGETPAGILPANGRQSGDPEMFPDGVMLDYSGVIDGVSAPNPSDVVWRRGGDPISAHVPDVTSPGPGITDATQKTDPQLKEADIHQKGAAYVPGANTASPQSESSKIGNHSLNSLAKGEAPTPPKP